MSTVEVQVSYDDIEYRVPLSSEPLTIGRAPENGLSLIDETVSWHHAAMWISGGQVWVRDLGSTNGVKLNGEALRDPEVVKPGDEVLIGERVCLRITGQPDREPAFVLEDLRRGLRHMLPPGSRTLASLGLSLEATLTVTEDGELSVEMAGSLLPLTLGEEIEAGDERLRVVRLGSRRRTVGQDAEPYPYRLTVRLDAPRGAEAVLLDRRTQRQHRIATENRVALMYQLARQVQDDLSAGKPPEESGWCQDADLIVGVWGKGERTASALPVLVHRIRKELSAAGFDHGFLEKDRKVLRARLLDVVVE